MPDYGAPDDHVTTSACPELDTDRSMKSTGYAGSVAIHCTVKKSWIQACPESTSHLQEEVAVAPMSPTLLHRCLFLKTQEEKFRSGSRVGRLDMLI